MAQELRAAFGEHDRSALVVIPLILVIAAAAIFVLYDLRSQVGQDGLALTLVNRQLTLTRDLTEAAYSLDATTTTDPSDLEGIAQALDEAHYGLVYGDPSRGFDGSLPAEASRGLIELEPEYLEMRATIDGVIAGTKAPLDLVRATGEFRGALEEPAGVIAAAATQNSKRLEATGIGVLIAAFGVAIVVFVLAPVVKRRRDNELQRRLRAAGRPDHLTGLVRRQTFLDRVDDAVQAAVSINEYSAVFVVDVDGMSRINSSLGHRSGDRVLQEMAARLKTALRAGDTIARLDDDVFGIVAPGIHRHEDAAIVARKILAAMENRFLEESLKVTACIGIALAPSDAKEADALTERATIAAVAAKQRGPMTYLHYSADAQALARGRVQIMDALRVALAEGGQLRLAFQPKIDLREGTMCGVEALVRWSHPVRGEMMPADFIPMVEESDLVLHLERWIVETACAQIAEWQRSGLGDINVSVNVSARQFRNGDLIDVVAGALDRAQINPSLLEIELTEGVLIDDTDRARDTLLALQELGVSIAIDDFGTGYSSLSYLKRFPIDTLKIDKTFIRELSAGNDDAAISTAIIALAHSLDLDVIAEGVEDANQLEVLLDLECDAVQGFLFARPLPAASVPGFIQRLPDVVGPMLPRHRTRRAGGLA